MQWRTRRKLLYGSSTIFVLLLITGVVFYVFFLDDKPTCFDGVQNGTERGIDCGGVCNLVCLNDAEPLRTISTGTFRVQNGIYNSVAVIENRNSDFGIVDLSYTLYAIDDLGREYGKRTGVITVPAGATVPIFESGQRISDSIQIIDTQITFGDTVWEKDVPVSPDTTVEIGFVENEDTEPFLRGVVTNNEVVKIGKQQIVAVVSDDEGVAVGVSSTVTDPLVKEDTQNIFFTWPEPFYLGSRICNRENDRRISSFLGDVVLAIDRSGSMDDEGLNPPEPLSTVQQAATRFIESLGSTDKAAVVSFANDATIDAELSGSSFGLAQIIDRINILDTGIQHTNFADGLRKAKEILESTESNNERKAVIVLTDGVATRPLDAGNPNYPEELAAEIAEGIKKKGIELYVIGLGLEVNDSFLKDVASHPDNYYSALDRSRLNAIYDEIATNICSKKPAIVKTYSTPVR